jgi:hypothetical protein
LSDRIANARSHGLIGSFGLQGSPENLFRDLPGLCQGATMHHYQKILKLKEGAARLVPVKEAIANVEAARGYEGAVHALFRTTPEFCSRWFRLSLDAPRVTNEVGESEQTEGSFDANAYDSAVRTNLLHFAALIVRQSGVAVNPASFRLPAADIETIRQQEAINRLNLNLALEHNRKAAGHIAQRIESAVARLLKGDLGLAVATSHSTEIPNLRAAWGAYGVLSHLQDEVMEIRRFHFAVQIVRENARFFPTAVCANLIENLESRALSEIDKILEKTEELQTTVSFDPRLPPTVGAQLDSPIDARSERIQTFLTRVDVLAARTLGQLAWFTVSACPLAEPSARVEAGS